MTSLLATDNVNAGRVAADALAVAITKTSADTEGDVVMITSMPGVPSLDQRAKGFKEVVTAKYKALDITAEKVADGKPATVLGIMNDLIANTGDLRGVFVSDPITAQAVSQGRGRKEDKRQDQYSRRRFGREARQILAGRRDRRARGGGPLPHGL